MKNLCRVLPPAPFLFYALGPAFCSAAACMLPFSPCNMGFLHSPPADLRSSLSSHPPSALCVWHRPACSTLFCSFLLALRLPRDPKQIEPDTRGRHDQLFIKIKFCLLCGATVDSGATMKGKDGDDETVRSSEGEE